MKKHRPVHPLFPLVSGPAAKVLWSSVAGCDLEAMRPIEKARMKRCHSGQVHRGHRLAAKQRLVRATAAKTGTAAQTYAALLLTLELRHALRPLQRIRSERSLREEVLEEG